jgi:hypothetical protein
VSATNAARNLASGGSRAAANLQNAHALPQWQGVNDREQSW